MTSVSLALTTYNGGHYLAEQLSSLARQTVLPAELIVADDHSTDNTLEIIASFASSSPFPVRVHQNTERLGYKRNFMKAAGLCTSDIIAFCDQDDVWVPSKLEKCLQAFENTDVLLSYHCASVVNERLEPQDLTRLQAAAKPLNPPLSLPPLRYGLGFTLLFRRSLMDYQNLWAQSADFFEPSALEAHDQWFFFLASCLGTIAYLDEPLVLYRQHEGNTEGWGTRLGAAGKLKKLLMIDSMELIQGRAACLQKRALILEQIATSASSDLMERAAKAAAGYKTCAQFYEQRQAIYRDSVTARLTRFLGLWKSGGYGPVSAWGMGPKEGMRDLMTGVLSLHLKRSQKMDIKKSRIP